MKSAVGKFLKTAAPIATLAIPGLGPVASAALGAGLGALGGGGLKGALLGGLSGGLGGGWANSIIGKLAPTLGKTASAGLSGALSGAASGLASGNGLKGALMGGALGGFGNAALSGVKIPGLGSAGTTINWEKAAPGYSTGIETVGRGGVIGKIADSLNVGGAASTNPSAGGNSSIYSKVSPVVSGGLDYLSQEKAGEELEAQQRKALGLMTGIMDEEFDPGDIQNTPGYQFSLDQGQKAIDRASAARGGYFSGQAMKDSAGYAQNLADQTWQNAYNNWLSDRSQRMSAAGAAGNLYQGIGETQASTTLNQGQTLAQSLAALLGQMDGGNNVYNPQTGTYYDPTANSDLMKVLRQMGYQ